MIISSICSTSYQLGNDDSFFVYGSPFKIIYLYSLMTINNHWPLITIEYSLRLRMM